MGKIKKAITFGDQIRIAIRTCGRTGNSICIEAQVDTGNFARFMAGKRWLSEDSLNRVAKVIGIEVIMKSKAKGK